MKVNVTDATVTNTTFYRVNMSSPEQCMVHGQSQNNNSILSYNAHTGECLVFMNSYLLEMEDHVDYVTYEWNCKTSCKFNRRW
ncbi:hypothetical protein DPMN_090334 [Dreissena polymorpha]|uniref:Uncharacterized protein n=1 Tax=Dreissena polymorpha TaxID=45954 RepID=A0A9D4KYG0_DREPO|nr:hypothetical protein DPMN_090334 [Dreissena polymorpha]